MKLLTLAVVCVAGVAAGCATSNGAYSAPNAVDTSNSRVAGVVNLPSQLGGSLCDRINVVAMVGHEQVGRSTVRASKSRCTYEISNLPSDVDVSLEVKAEGVTCGDGKTLTGGDAASVKMHPNQIKTQDLAATCGS